MPGGSAAGGPGVHRVDGRMDRADGLMTGSVDGAPMAGARRRCYPRSLGLSCEAQRKTVEVTPVERHLPGCALLPALPPRTGKHLSPLGLPLSTAF